MRPTTHNAAHTWLRSSKSLGDEDPWKKEKEECLKVVEWCIVQETAWRRGGSYRRRV
jgi:hypothetical protein